MKKLFWLLVILIGGYWLYGRCTHKENTKSDVLKQVTVTAKVANLRSGPGTNHNIISVNADGTGGNLQVRRGTKLDVLSESSGWFKVRVPGEERTAYIKQTLCNDPTVSSGKKKGKGSGSRKGSGSSSSSSSATSSTTSDAPAAPSVSPDEEEVVEITTGRASQDEVIF